MKNQKRNTLQIDRLNLDSDTKSLTLNSAHDYNDNDEEDPFLNPRVKKTKKLQDFFGDIAFTKVETRPDRSSKYLTNIEYILPPMNELLADDEDDYYLDESVIPNGRRKGSESHPNEIAKLDQKSKMKLSKRRMKLVKVMGGDIEDHIIAQTQSKDKALLIERRDDALDSETSSSEESDEVKVSKETQSKRLLKLKQYLGDTVTIADIANTKSTVNHKHSL